MSDRGRAAHDGAVDPKHVDASDTDAIDVYLRDTDATDALARALATTQPAAVVVHLHGDLGAGKSTLARAWLRTLGVTGAIRSPTYTLVERYALRGGGEALHLDLYRIGSAGELEFLALDDADARLWLVEWPERGLAALPAADLRIELALEGPGRRCRLVAGSRTGRDWLAAAGLKDRLRAFSEP